MPEGASRLAHAGKQALKTALVEGPGTEIPQTAIERFAGGQEIGTPEAFDEYALAGAKGAIGGGAIGGGLGLVAPRETTLPAPAITGAEPEGVAAPAIGSPTPQPGLQGRRAFAEVQDEPSPARGEGEEGDVGLADLDGEQQRHMVSIGAQGPLTAAAAAGGLPSSTPASATPGATTGRRSVMTSDAGSQVQDEPATERPSRRSRRSRAPLSPLGAEMAERARSDIAREQVRTAELRAAGRSGGP